MSFVRLSPAVVQKLMKHRAHESEENQWTGEVHLVTEKKTSTRYILVTDCCFYMFGKKIKKQDKKTQVESLFDLTSCVVTENRLKVTFSSSEFTFATPECETLCANLYRQYRYLTWNLNVGGFAGIATIKEAMSVPAPHVRPEHLLLHRYVAMCVSKSVSIEPKVLDMVLEFDKSPVKELEFKDFELQNVVPIFSAISMEPDVRTITFDNFSPTNLGLILVWILVNQNKLLHTKFKNYKTATFKGLTNRRSPYNNVTRVTFQSCSCSFIQKFFQALKGATYSFDCLVFRAMKFNDTLCETFVTVLDAYTIASAIRSLVFIDFESELPLFDFLKRVVESSESLTELVANNCGIDVCKFISILNQTECNLQALTLRRNYGKSAIGSDEIIPHSIMNLDVGNCDWSRGVMSSFLLSVLRWTRKAPLALKLDRSRLSEPWMYVFAALQRESLSAVITELDMSYNEMDVQTFEKFLAVLGSQSPSFTQSHKKLMYLSLSHCFTSDIEKCISLFGQFFSAREMWGLSLCDICTVDDSEHLSSLIKQLRNIQGLIAVDVSGNFFDENAMFALLRFIRDSPSIAEIGIDRTGISDTTQLLDFYKRIVRSSNILAMKRPIKELEQFESYPEVKEITTKLALKRQFSTTNQRLSLYLSLSGNFSTRIFRSYTESHLSDDSPLFENNFRNPIASLFTVASMSHAEADVDPLASMVAEYVATSGRYGIVPPTAPPPDAPRGKLEMPAIFATMDPNIEDEDVVDDTPDLAVLSREIGAILHENGEHPSIFKNEKRYDPNATLCLPRADFSS